MYCYGVREVTNRNGRRGLPALNPNKSAHFFKTNNTPNMQRENYRQNKEYKKHLVGITDSELKGVGDSGVKLVIILSLTRLP
jgi:hypothetical protein